MQNAADSGASGFDHHRLCVALGFAGVHDDRAIRLLGERELGGERASLCIAR